MMQEIRRKVCLASKINHLIISVGKFIKYLQLSWKNSLNQIRSCREKKMKKVKFWQKFMDSGMAKFSLMTS